MTRNLLLASIIALATAACGSDSDTTPDAGAPDAAGPIALFPGLPITDEAVCVTLGADYRNNVGSMAVVGLPSLTVVDDVLPGATSGDPVVRLFDHKLYVINRGANNVTVINTATTPWAVEQQFSTGAGTDPQDIALAGTKAFVTLYNSGNVQVWDLSQANPSAPIANVDLSSADPDGVPQANSIYISGTKAYVSLDLLDTGNPPSTRGNGKIVVIDTATSTISDTLTLKYPDPYDFIVPVHVGAALAVATQGDFSGTTGCLELINPSTNTIGDCIIENSRLGGVISSIAEGHDGAIYVAVSAFDAQFNQTAQIREIDTHGALVATSLTGAATEIPTDVAWSPSGHLVYADYAGGGIRVWDLATSAELTTAALDIGLSPASANGIVCFGR